MVKNTYLAPQPSATRLYLLDALRFLAALMVVLYHFTVYPYPFGWNSQPKDIFPLLSSFAVYGYLGVYLFFVISGFVIMKSALGRTVGDFVASRVARLFPAYWVAVLFAGLAFPLLSGRSVDYQGVRYTLVNLTMLQVPFQVPNLDGVYWTLWVELCFYILVGVILVTGLTYKKIVALAALWPLLAVLVKAWDKNAAQLFQPDYAPFFAAGIGIFLVYYFGHSVLHWLVIVANTLIGASSLAENSVYVSQDRGIQVAPSIVLLVALAFVLLVAIAVLTRWKSATGQVGTFLGRLTYPLYLMHVYAGLLAVHVLTAYLPPWATLSMGIVWAIGVALVVNVFVENTLAGRLRRAISRSFERASSA